MRGPVTMSANDPKRTFAAAFGARIREPFPFCFAGVPPSMYWKSSIGWVAEWLKAPVLKTGRRASVSWVQIPPHPPFTSLTI